MNQKKNKFIELAEKAGPLETSFLAGSPREDNQSISDKDSKQLAAIIVGYRLLNMHKELAMECMAELLRRKEAGDDWDYEKYIDEELEKSPQLPPVGDAIKRATIRTQISDLFDKEIKAHGKRHSK